MKTRRLQSALTLIEILTVMAIIVVLAVVSVPAIDAFFGSMGSSGSAEAMIDAALSNARANAMTRQKYVGIRFQKIYDAKGPLRADQYMIFIINEPGLKNSEGFQVQNAYRALDGVKPIKLPSETTVLDVRDKVFEDDLANLYDRTTFTIIFAPSGNLKIEQIVHVLRVNDSDMIFNNISYTSAMFQDDFGDIDDDALLQSVFVSETSCRSFYICSSNELKNAFKSSVPLIDYLLNVRAVQINPYTGKIITMD